MRGVINSGSIRLLSLLGIVVPLVCQSTEGRAGDERKQLAFEAVDRNADRASRAALQLSGVHDAKPGRVTTSRERDSN
jgi:hypothetical protein